MKSKEEFTIEKSPLKASDGNTRYIEKEGVAHLSPTLGIKMLILFFKLVLLGLWSVLFYDFIIDDFRMSKSFWFYIIYIILCLLLSITFLLSYFNHKTKRYFNKNTGKFILRNIDFSGKEKKIKNILGIQIIGYQKYQRVHTGETVSTKALFTYFQLIIVMKNLKRYNVATFRKRKNVKEVANKLSIFLMKPIHNEIEKFESIDEKTKRLSINYRSRFVLQDYFEINISKEELLERLNRNKHFKIIETDKNRIIIGSEPLDIFGFTLGKIINQGIFEPFKAYVDIKQSHHSLKINMKTKFRYEFIIYIAVFLFLLLLSFYNIALIIISVIVLFWTFQRGDEKTFFQIIKNDVLLDDRTSNIIE